MIKYIFRLTPLVLILTLWFIPDLLLAQGPGGFVNCEGTSCSACNLVDMTNKIIVWLLGIIFLIFAGLMTVAGFGLVTSGGNPAALNAAKTKFTNAIIGIMIVFSAWLIVDLIMKKLVQSEEGVMGEITGWGPWSQVKCMEQTETTPFVDINTGQGGTPVASSTPQVPGSTDPGECSVPALTAMVSDEAKSMEMGASVIYKDANLQQCATKFINLVGNGARVNSAYRPQEYQTHLFEIKDRWCTKGLKYNAEATCSALKSAISAEVNKHFGSNWACGAVSQNGSKHSSNGAVDIGGISNHSDSAIQAKASESCLVWRNYPGDPVHYDLKPSCTCN